MKRSINETLLLSEDISDIKKKINFIEIKEYLVFYEDDQCFVSFKYGKDYGNSMFYLFYKNKYIMYSQGFSSLVCCEDRIYTSANRILDDHQVNRFEFFSVIEENNYYQIANINKFAPLDAIPVGIYFTNKKKNEKIIFLASKSIPDKIFFKNLVIRDIEVIFPKNKGDSALPKFIFPKSREIKLKINKRFLKFNYSNFKSAFKNTALEKIKQYIENEMDELNLNEEKLKDIFDALNKRASS